MWECLTPGDHKTKVLNSQGAATVRNVLERCLLCKRRTAWAGQQIMSYLPTSWLAANKPPFLCYRSELFWTDICKTRTSHGEAMGMFVYLHDC